MKISVVLDLANDYSVNSGVFRDSGNYVKEYANLCSSTALYLLALQSDELSEDQRQDLIKKCEIFLFSYVTKVLVEHSTLLLQGAVLNQHLFNIENFIFFF